MLNSDQIQDLRGMLMEACDLHIANGGTIISGRFQGLTDPNQCCPVRCLAEESDNYPVTKEVASLLGVGYSLGLDTDVWDFIHAFDDEPGFPASHSPMAALGHELRTMYIKE